MKNFSHSYSKMVNNNSQKSPIFKNILFAFLTGGIICTFGQFLLNTYLSLGLTIQNARSLSSCSLILLSIIFTALHLYDKLAKFAGAGTLVPITGFANAVCAPAIEFKSEGFITGVGTKMFVIAGPVIVYGISSGIIYGVIIWLFSLY
ncbi:MAG: stage V sporulation protein AC [Clostridia bacterium]|nr:stage V sporulation protein AC [Clostridia bacterium]